MGEQYKLIYVLNHYSKDSDQHLFHVIGLLKEMAGKGVKIALIIERCETTPEYIHDNITIYGQKQKKGIKRVWEFRSIIKYLLSKEGYKKVFIRISTKAAAVAIKYAKRYGAETYFWSSGMGLDIMRNQQIVKRISWYLKSYMLFNYVKKNIDFFTTGPETMIEYYHKEAGVKKEKLTILYNDIDLKRFSKADLDEKNALRKKYNLEIDKIYILFVHRFSPVRRTLYYIPYIPKQTNREDVVFLLIGAGPEEAAVKAAVEESGIKNVHFLGSKPNAQIHEYNKACDIFFNPSYCEGFPRVIIEAMASGMPIVTTNAGGTLDLLGDFQRDFVVPIDDRDLLSKKLNQMIDDKEARERCIKENLLRVNRYSTETVAEMYINTIFRK